MFNIICNCLDNNRGVSTCTCTAYSIPSQVVSEDGRISYTSSLMGAFLNIKQGQHLNYIKESTNAVVTMKPRNMNIKEGLSFTIKHENLDEIRDAASLLHSLLEKVGSPDDYAL